ncbi:MAG: glycosyl hydrolase family 28-related protein [Cyanobacteriota bacterium]
MKDQARENENGIYHITRSIFPPYLRFARTDTLEEQMIVRVSDGDVNANTVWRLSQISPPTFVPQEWDGEWKAHVRTATNGHVSLIERNVDSVTLEVGDRVLVRAQFNDRENGIYVIPVAGHQWERANDMRIKDDYNGVIVYVSEGEFNANTLWVVASTGAIRPGESSLIFRPFFSPIARSALIVRRIEELRGISGEIGSVIKVLGANEPGDGGEGDFSWAPSGSDTTHLYDDGGIKIRGHGGWWQRLEAGSSPVNVKWFGAKGDGSTNDTAALQRAIAALTPALNSPWVCAPAECAGNQIQEDSFPELLFPSGHYVIDQELFPVIVGLTELRIRGEGQPILRQTNSTANTIRVTSINKVWIEGLSFVGGANQVRYENGNNDASGLTIRDCNFFGSQATAVTVTNPFSTPVVGISGTALIERCTFRQSVGAVLDNSAMEHFDVRNSWVSFIGDAFDGPVFINGSAAAFACLLRMQSMMLVPPPSRSLQRRWIDNYGRFVALDCRFGGEEGGIPILRHRTALNPYPDQNNQFVSFDRCDLSAGANYGAYAGVVVLDCAGDVLRIPNVIRINGGIGPLVGPMIAVHPDGISPSYTLGVALEGIVQNMLVTSNRDYLSEVLRVDIDQHCAGWVWDRIPKGLWRVVRSPDGPFPVGSRHLPMVGTDDTKPVVVPTSPGSVAQFALEIPTGLAALSALVTLSCRHGSGSTAYRGTYTYLLTYGTVNDGESVVDYLVISNTLSAPPPGGYPIPMTSVAVTFETFARLGGLPTRPHTTTGGMACVQFQFPDVIGSAHVTVKPLHFEIDDF